MNILYDNTIFYLQQRGGVLRIFSEIIRRIEKFDDTDVEVLKGLRVLPKRLLRRYNVFADFKLATDKYDIYHPTYYSNSIRRRNNVKTVVTVYDMIHELYLFRFKAFRNDIKIKKKSIFNADQIICISHNTKEDLKKIYNIEENRISVVHLGASFTHNNLENIKFNKPEKPYILYVGRREYYKNFDILLKAFYLLNIKKSFGLVCFGGGEFCSAELLEFKKLNLENSIRHIEGSDELLQLYYHNAHIFVYPSLYEGFGLPILEAMSNNCVVVASNTGAIAEITDNAALLFSPDNVDELCSCIKMLTADSQAREQYIKKGKERVKDFSWDKTAQKTYDVYKKTLNSEVG